MNGVGIDTASFFVRLDPWTSARVARALPQERRTKGGEGGTYYGNFGDWSATLHARAANEFGHSALVLTASLPRLLYGENTRPVGTLGAEEARQRLFDRLAALTSVDLRDATMTLCRVDYCVTLSPYPDTKELIALAASVDLPRRERAAMSNGVAFFYANKKSKDTLYDKQTELAHSIAKLTSRAKVKAAPEVIAVQLAALKRAERRLRHGAVRLECRLTTGKQISSRFATKDERRSGQPLPPPTPQRVLTTANAETVLGHFRDQLAARLTTYAATDAVTKLREALGPVRAQRAFALLALSQLTGSLELAAVALGISATAAGRLAEAARSAGVAKIDASRAGKTSGLALPAISAAQTDKFERRLQAKWQRTHQVTTRTSDNYSLTSDD